MSNSNLITCITMLVAGYYIYICYNNLYALMNPMAGVIVAANEPTIAPLWVEGDKFNLVTFLSTSPRKQRIDIASYREKGLFLLEKKGIILLTWQYAYINR